MKKEKVLNKLLTAALAVLFFTAVTASASAATTIYVPEGRNPTIQQAVNNASAGDTIIVRDAYTGTKENVDVNVPHLTIRSQNGSANCIVNASNQDDHVFNVTANYVNVSKYVNATSVTADSWLFLNVSYSDMDISRIVEDSSVLYR
jgi:hypothetical protein